MENQKKTSENFCELPNKTKNKPKSKNTKAAGLKSTFVTGDKLLVTSFGKRNEAIFEKEIAKEISSLNNPEAFSMEKSEKKFIVKSKRNASVTGLPDNPLMSSKAIGEDVIGCKDVLEKEYFGKTFSDNIHIQLIYNILDIKKILAVHINNIIYEFDNLTRNEEHSDFIGYMSTRNIYKDYINPPAYFSDRVKNNLAKSREYFYSLAKNPRLKYFGEIFYKTIRSKNKGNKSVVDEEKLFYILGMLGDVRQFCFHAKIEKNVSLYNLENSLKSEAKAILDDVYNNKINVLNKNFLETNAKNIEILFDVLNTPKEERATLVKDFYDFIIKKQNKNMGFSLKTLREQMIDSNCPTIKDEKYNTNRSKFYRLLDFIIFRYYKTAHEKTEQAVSYLRSCNDNTQKDLFYVKEADNLWKDIKTPCEALKDMMNEKKLSENPRDDLITKEIKNAIEEIKINTDTNYFSKIIYLLTIFLDGKEINDLITTLINKFENIESLYNFIKETKLEHNFCEEYKFFEKSAEISAELRVVNSFARMTHKEADAKQIMYIEAAELLGFDASDDEIKNYIDEYLLNENFGKGQHDFRNFIASNVISSSRFKYLIRYANPRKIRKVAKNENVVRFVLKKLPETQIERYYSSCYHEECKDKEKMLSDLTNIITKMDFKDFSNVKQKVQKGSKEESFKAKKQAAITLYLTILYHLVKNLIYVNSRYTIAFHTLERDMQLYGMSLKVIKGLNEKANMYCDLTKELIDRKKENITKWFRSIKSPSWNQKKRKWRIERSCEYLVINISNSNEIAIKKYRDNVAHIDVISNIDKYIGDISEFNSYFELFHYIMQRKLIDVCNSTDPQKFPKFHKNIEKYAPSVLTYNTYCKDFVKSLNIPFGYNLARFKNLSINGLFDMHDNEEKV